MVREHTLRRHIKVVKVQETGSEVGMWCQYAQRCRSKIIGFGAEEWFASHHVGIGISPTQVPSHGGLRYFLVPQKHLTHATTKY